MLHVTETVQGGIGSYFECFSGFDKREVESVIVAPAQHARFLNSRFDVITFDYPKRGMPSVLRMLRAAIDATRRLRPDVVFCHSTFALAALVAIRLLFPKVLTIYCAHGWAASRYSESPALGTLVRFIEGRLCGLASVVVNISEHDRAFAETHGYRGCHVVVENAVAEAASDARGDLFADAEAGDGTIDLLFCGRLDKQKGLDILLEAFCKAREVRPELRLHVVGSSVVDGFCARGGSEGVFFHGWVDRGRIDDWYRSADALIVPSRWEGFGLVVPEAFRNGTPVLASDRGALPDLVSPGRTGLVFPLDPEAIFLMLTQLDHKALRGMRGMCRASFESRFTVHRFRCDFVTVLQEVLGTGLDLVETPAQAA